MSTAMTAAHHPAEAPAPHRRRPDPGPIGGSIRDLAKGVPALKTMALEPIGDIASPALTDNTPTGNLVWETATDWDNAVDEDGVVHESVTNTDHSDDSTIKMGYSYANFDEITPTPVAAWPLHEDSGSTANDLAGTHDGTNNGPTLGQTGILDTNAYGFDGTDDKVSITTQGSIDESNLGNAVSLSAWVILDSLDTNDWETIMAMGGNGNDVINYATGRNGGEWKLYLDTDGGGNHEDSSTVPNTGQWYFVVLSYDGANSDTHIYVDGNSIYNSSTFSGDLSSSSEDWRIGDRGDKNEVWPGEICDARIWDVGLSGSQVQTLYDVVDTESSLTTATKSFATASTPDLEQLSYSLNSQSITLDVLGSPGTASEEVVSQPLDGAASYSLSWSNSHTNFRLKPRLSTSNPETTPTFSKGVLAQ